MDQHYLADGVSIDAVAKALKGLAYPHLDIDHLTRS